MDWKVRFIDYPQQFRNMETEIMGTIKTVLSQGDLMLRQQLRDFENNLAAFVGTKYAVGMSNCTDALHLSLRAAGIGAGDEVITVSHTFVATAEAIHHAGGTPVLIDIGDDHNMDVNQLEKAITKKTKCILPVHLNGRVCRMDEVMKVARAHGLIVLEDSAQALGASYKGGRGGTFGIAGCFSFYPAKLLGAYGDAGAVVTSDSALAEKLRQLRDHGRTDDGDVSGWSFNCRLDNLQAALLDIKLKRLPKWIDRRRELAGLYQQNLETVEELRLPPSPETGQMHHDVYQNYEVEAVDRDGLVKHLKTQGIEILISWGGKGVHQFPALGLTHYKLPRTEELFSKVLMLPLHPELRDEQVVYVSDCVKKFYSKAS